MSHACPCVDYLFPDSPFCFYVLLGQVNLPFMGPDHPHNQTYYFLIFIFLQNQLFTPPSPYAFPDSIYGNIDNVFSL